MSECHISHLSNWLSVYQNRIENLLLVYHSCAVCVLWWVHSGLLRACGAGLLLIWGMLLPSEQSKWGLSEIKCHRSEGLRVVEFSQNISCSGSHAAWSQTAVSILLFSFTHLSNFLSDLHNNSFFLFSGGAKDFFITQTHLECCYENAHASTCAALQWLHCNFISVDGTKNNCCQFTYSKCQKGTKADSVGNK